MKLDDLTIDNEHHIIYGLDRLHSRIYSIDMKTGNASILKLVPKTLADKSSSSSSSSISSSSSSGSKMLELNSPSGIAWYQYDGLFVGQDSFLFKITPATGE